MSVGRLAAVKNHPMMLRAFHDVARRHPNVRLVIVGRRTGAVGHREGDRADADGGPGDGDSGSGGTSTRSWREADVFVLTSRYEGISVALLEAMRSGLPVIGTSVGGIPETVVDGKTGLLVGPEDHEGLVEAMSALATSPELRGRMGAEGYDYFVGGFSPRHAGAVRDAVRPGDGMRILYHHRTQGRGAEGMHIKSIVLRASGHGARGHDRLAPGRRSAQSGLQRAGGQVAGQDHRRANPLEVDQPLSAELPVRADRDRLQCARVLSPTTARGVAVVRSHLRALRVLPRGGRGGGASESDPLRARSE